MVFLADLQAAHDYLQTAAAFPSTLTQVRLQQFEQMQTLIGKASFSTREASEALLLLRSSSCWDDSQKQALAVAVQERQSAAAIVSGTRHSLQDFSSMCLFFTDVIWMEIMKPELSDFGRCMTVMPFLTSLGLRNPTETTIQFLTSLLLHCPESKLPCSSASDLHQSFLSVKKYVRTYLSTVPSVPNGYPLIEKLPSNWELLDARWKEHGFKGSKPAQDAPVNLTAVVT